MPRYTVGAVALVGGAQVTTQAMRGLLEQGSSLHLLSKRGHYLGHLVQPDGGNVELLRAQVQRLEHPEVRTALARAVVGAKLHNSGVVLARLLKRARAEYARSAVETLREAKERAGRAADLGALRGLEGNGAQAYFAALGELLGPTWGFGGRNYRPPKDPVNAMLSFGYTLVLSRLLAALHLVGLHPGIGFLHASRGRRPALALDLLEEYRAALVDGLVFTSVLGGRFQPEDFRTDAKGVLLQESARKRFLELFEARLQDEITAPNGKRYRYEALFLHQARAFSRCLRDPAHPYRPLTIR